MRDRRRLLLPSVLAVTFAFLLVTPIAVLAASGLPATITMTPKSAGPGATVEVVGLDFPASEAVELQLTTTAGPVQLASATTEAGGYFRQRVVLPADVAPGFWELRATGSNGAVAVHIFEAGDVVQVEVAAAAAETAAAEPTRGGAPSGANVLVLLVLILLVGGVGGAAVFVYYKLHRVHVDPGMATGDDPFWESAPSDP